MTSPFTQDDLNEIHRVANLASEYPVVTGSTLCRIGAVLQIQSSYRDTTQSLLRASGYTVQQISGHTLVVTGVVDEVALLDAQIATLTARREELLAQRRPLDLFEEEF